MKLLLAVTLVLVLAACGGKSDAPQSGCDLAGTYRLRFDARVGQWLWLRFKVERDMSAKLLSPKAITTKDDKLKIDPDPAACKLAAIAKTESGELLASITIDKKTNEVTGTLRGVGMRSGVALRGVRDVGPSPSKHACVTQGMYALVVPAEQAWQATEGGRNCETAAVRVPFLVEYLGDKLVIDQIEPDGRAAWAAEDVFVDEADPCQVEVRFRHDEWYVYSKIYFGGDKVTAEVTSANVEVVQGGDSWRCEIRTPMSWVEKT
jgi:hypothetical protein